MATDEFDKLLGQRIRSCRENLGFSQSDLARELGVSFQQIQKYERGLNRVSAGTLKKMAALFGMEPGEFFGPSPVVVSEFEGNKRATKMVSLYKQLPEDMQRCIYGIVREAAKCEEEDG